ncbi:MAG: DUF4136 domain-containing protein [Bacteroidales bacterium]|nr:DUF4136 domain-containing protein [Bacteroidales bacterium]
MKLKVINPVMIMAILIGLVSCYPGGAEYYSDTDVVLTSYNDQFNFSEIQTYYLADSIRHVVDEGKEPDRTFDGYIISELERNLNTLGFQRLDTNDINAGQQPDVAIVVTQVIVQNYNIYYSYPWYPGWGWGYYYKDSQYWGYPGYGWGYYPGYPTYVSSYEVGTVQWQMFDPDNVDEDNQVIYVEWMGAINGVLGTSKTGTEGRITDGIDQAFLQSPYLSGK